MNSMTGYGKADYQSKKILVSVELSSVNSRFLEFAFRLPKQMAFLEPRIKEIIAGGISRGKINVSINFSDHGSGIEHLEINQNLTDEIYASLNNLKRKYKLAGDIDITQFLQFPDIFALEKSANIDNILAPIVKTAVNRALIDLIRMRKQEGNNLKKDLLGRLDILKRLTARVEQYAPQNVIEYRDRLHKRLKEVMADITVNGNRLEEEVAFLAERSDITEECVRIKSHIDQFRKSLSSGNTVGKRLNFILQEFNREVNTIGSKAGGSQIAPVILELKEEVEKMREQVQNIE